MVMSFMCQIACGALQMEPNRPSFSPRVRRSLIRLIWTPEFCGNFFLEVAGVT